MLAIYTRLSREDEESTSIENQLREGEEFALANGFKDYRIYNEGEGVSGTLPIIKRPEFNKLYQDVQLGKYSVVWFRDQNRMARNTLTFMLFVEACKQTNTKIFNADTEFNYNNATELLTASILSNLNTYIPGKQSEQTKKVLKDRVKEGKAHGTPPYGYYKDENGYLKVHNEEAKTVKEIFALSLQGSGYGLIAKHLNDKGIPTRYKKLNKGTYKYENRYTGEITVRNKKDAQWVGKSVGDIIKNPIHKGERKWKKEIYKVDNIVTPEHWQKVNDHLKENMNNTGKKTHYKYLLKGLLTCGKCGRNMYGRINHTSKDYYYQCSSKRNKSCGNRSINISKIESFIWRSLLMEGKIVEHLNSKLNVSTTNDKLEALKNEKEKRVQEVQQLQKQRENAFQLVLEDRASKEDLQPNLTRIDNKSKALNEQLEAINKQMTLLKNSVEVVNKFKTQIDFFKENTPFNEKKAILDNLIDRITITSTEKRYEVEVKYKVDVPNETYNSVGFKDAIFVNQGNGRIYNRQWEDFVIGNRDNALKTVLEGMKKNNGNGGSTPPSTPDTGSTPPPNSTTNHFSTNQTESITFNTVTDVALVGGGAYPQPGEISLSHNGVLFLDELPEFKRGVLEVMRQPLEDREVTISRAKFTVTYPSSFMLVASMNPSPSGYFNDPGSPMTSSPAEMQRYLGKISGPLLDRIDIHIEVTPVPFEKLSEERRGESSVEIRKRVTQARQRQTERFSQFGNVHYNAQMSVKHIALFCQLDESSRQLLKTAMERLNLSARAYDRILKVSRTIADLEGKANIEGAHISEAIQYRSLDREGWLG